MDMEWCSHCLRLRQTKRERFLFSDEFCSSCVSCGKILADSSGPDPISFQIRRKYNGSGRRIRRVGKSKLDVRIEKKGDSSSIDEKKDSATSSEEVKRRKTIDDE